MTIPTFERTLLLLVVAACGLFPYATNAMVVRGGEAYEVGADTTLEGDLYYLGKTFTLAGTTTDDLMVVGSQAALLGHVGADIFVLGGTVVVGGSVAGDVRVVGGEITVASSTIAQDLVAIGGTIIIEEGATIQGDLLVYGDRLVLNGAVNGNVEAHVRSAEIKGVITHDANITVQESLAITDPARIDGALLYRAPRPAFISETVTIGGERTYEQSADAGSSASEGITLLPSLWPLLLSFVAALLLIVLHPRASEVLATRVMTGGGMNAVKGALLFFAVPFAALALCITVVGLIPGLLLLFCYGALVLVTFAVAPIVAGLTLARVFHKEEVVRWDWVLLGAIALSFIVLVPIIGTFVGLLVFFATYGILARSLFEIVTQHRLTETTPATPSSPAPSSAHDTSGAQPTVESA